VIDTSPSFIIMNQVNTPEKVFDETDDYWNIFIDREKSPLGCRYNRFLNNKINLKSYHVEESKENAKGYLITFGCSWTFGLGASYESGMSEEEYNKISFDEKLCYNNSWRKLVSDKLNFENINFSLPCCSNEAQFMLAEKFFSSKFFKKIKNEKPIIVLWGITALSRSMFWSVKSQSYTTIFPTLSQSKFNNKTDELYRKSYYATAFDEQMRKIELEEKIIFWDTVFEQFKIKNFWFDSFCSNDYSAQLKNLIYSSDRNRDLLYLLCLKNAKRLRKKMKGDVNHMSFGNVDNKKIKFLLNQGLVNPYTLHPVKIANQQIANIFTDVLM